jgi:hypothetical protein
MDLFVFDNFDRFPDVLLAKTTSFFSIFGLLDDAFELVFDQSKVGVSGLQQEAHEVFEKVCQI